MRISMDISSIAAFSSCCAATFLSSPAEDFWAKFINAYMATIMVKLTPKVTMISIKVNPLLFLIPTLPYLAWL